MTRPRLALIAVLGLAAALRFVGLGWGLRHRPHWDERVFVENASRMVERRELDHRFYEYPGLFFDLLAPVLGIARADQADARSYLVARAVVAAFGTASVLVLFLLGRRLLDERTALAAALLLAVSPIDVWTAHMVRPDVPLQTFVLLAFLAFTAIGPRLRGDVLSGLAVGAATAVKFTGALLLPSYVAARLIAGGRRLAALLLAAVAAALVLVVATPYAILAGGRFLEGVRVQWGYHYGAGGFSNVAGHAAYYLRAIVTTLGPLGACLLAVGAIVSFRNWRRWLPLVLHPLVTVAVHATAEVRYDRFLVPTIGVLCLLAALPLARVLTQRPVTAWLAVLATAAVPFARSVTYVREIAQPGTQDRILEWVEARAPAHARIVTTDADLGLDRGRFEVLSATGSPDRDRLLARSADLVVWTSAAAPPGLEGVAPAFIAEPETPRAGERIAAYLVPQDRRPRYAPVSLAQARLSASERSTDADQARDGSLTTYWSTDGPQRPGQWFQVELPAPVVLGRITLQLGFHPFRRARDLHVLVREDGGEWRPVVSASGRSAADEPESPTGFEDVLLLPATRARAVRLVQVGAGDRRWGFAEIRLDALQ